MQTKSGCLSIPDYTLLVRTYPGESLRYCIESLLYPSLANAVLILCGGSSSSSCVCHLLSPEYPLLNPLSSWEY